MKTPISIIGAGHCGCALVADLSQRNMDTLLYAHPQHSRNLDSIQQAGGLSSSLSPGEQFSPRLTTSIAEALAFSRFIVVTVPAYGHQTIIDELARHDLSEHIIICITGNFFSLVARRQLNAKALIETSTSPYASRFEDGAVRITGAVAGAECNTVTGLRREPRDAWPSARS